MADDRAVGDALRLHFPESGVYYLPGNGNEPGLRAELYEAGPTGFVILDVDGRPEVDPAIMLGGLLLDGLIVAILAGWMRFALGSLPTYRSRLAFSALAGAFAVVLVNFGDAVWWALPWGWELVQSFYNFTAVLVAGAILAHYIRPAADTSA